MAEPHSLKAGDHVTHSSWPEGEKRTLTGRFVTGKRGGYNEKGRYKVIDLPDERFMQIDGFMPTLDGHDADDYWAEAGLEKVDG